MEQVGAEKLLKGGDEDLPTGAGRSPAGSVRDFPVLKRHCLPRQGAG